MQQFARAFKNVFPHALCQWEDFSKQNAFAVRDAYLHDLISFNDDIQGTGAVTLAAIFAVWSACVVFKKPCVVLKKLMSFSENPVWFSKSPVWLSKNPVWLSKNPVCL